MTVAENAHADAVVLVRVSRTTQSRRVAMVVIDPTAASEPRDVLVILPAIASAADGGKLAGALLPVLAKLPVAAPAPAAAASPPSSEPVAAAPSATPPKDPPSMALNLPTSEARDTASAAPRSDRDDDLVPLVRGSAAVGVGSRSFSYHDRVSSSLKSYSLAGTPTLGGSLDVFPLARRRDALRGLGVYGDATVAIALSSQASGGAAATASGETSWTRWDVGARYVAPLGRRVKLGGTFGYARESFEMKLPVNSVVPSVAYSILRPALEGSVELGSLGVDVTGAYLVTLSGGDLESLGRATRIGGVEGRAVVRYAVGRHFGLSAGATYTRFFYSFAPLPGDSFVAGGALDQMMRGELALVGRY